MTKFQKSLTQQSTMDDPLSGSRIIEQLANGLINHSLGSHLCLQTRNRRFRGAFGCTQHDVFVCWSLLNVINEGPAGGQPIHLLWTLLFFKTYDIESNLASRCGVDPKTYRKWTTLFIDRISELPLASYRLQYFGFFARPNHTNTFYYVFYTTD
jgi:hypothetical protein